MRTFRFHERDNVTVALEASGDIPAGHKTASRPIAAGEAVVKYGYPIGIATANIPTGGWVHEHNLQTALSRVSRYAYEPAIRQQEVVATGETFAGYLRARGEVGVRNEIWVIPTVGCVNGLAEKAAQRVRCEGLPAGVDDLVVFAHPYGCSQLGEDHEASRVILADMVRHPNAGGVLVIGLGCENNTMERFLELAGPLDDERVKVVVTQQVEDELEVCCALLRELRDRAEQDRRVPVPVSRLRVGLKCGGSDAFSGVTANALAGAVADRLIAGGGAAVLTEVPEVFGAETILFNRAVNEAVFQRAVDVVNRCKDYFLTHGAPVSANPSPGNREGGITTLEEKSLGCVQKAGTAPLVDVLRYGERLRLNGLTLLEGPGNDIVAVTALAASGCHMVLFTTGRGTPLGGPVPVVKVSSNSALAAKKKGWIDFDAGVLLEGETMEHLAGSLLKRLIDVASGARTRNETNGYRDFAIWKSGVTL
jgi:altronate hydrolase